MVCGFGVRWLSVSFEWFAVRFVVIAIRSVQPPPADYGPLYITIMMAGCCWGEIRDYIWGTKLDKRFCVCVCVCVAVKESVIFPATILFYLRRKVAQQTDYLPGPLGSPLSLSPLFLSSLSSCLSPESAFFPNLLSETHISWHFQQLRAEAAPCHRRADLSQPNVRHLSASLPVPPRHCHQSPLRHVAQQEAVIPSPSPLS